MEAFPPNYDSATTRNPWAHIAASSHLNGQDLAAASLVCKAWHAIFAPELWGDPASHWLPSSEVQHQAVTQGSSQLEGHGREADDASFKFARFKRCCRKSRPATRDLIHTLRLPVQVEDAESSLYSTTSSTLPATWLRDLVASLPNLQSLTARENRQVDHEALLAFKTTDGLERKSLPSLPQLENLAYRLALLDLSCCINATPKGLTAFLNHTSSLIYLNFSGLEAAKDAVVLQTLKSMRRLKVLILKKVGTVKNDKIDILASVIGRRLRWLDLTSCDVDDVGVRTLLTECIGFDNELDNELPTYTDARIGHGAKVTDPSKFASDVYHNLTSSMYRHLAIEDDPENGVTHLVIGSNSLSYSCAERLMNSPGLSYIDLGSDSRFRGLRSGVPFGRQDYRSRSSLTSLRLPFDCFFTLMNLTSESHEGTSLSFSTAPALIRILTLTNIPAHVSSDAIHKQIINLIRHCARVSQDLQHEAPSPTYSAHPGSSKSPRGYVRATQSLQRLQIVNLEIATATASSHIALPSPASSTLMVAPRGWNYGHNTKSVTGDADSEALWRHAENTDFSFFDENTQVDSESGKDVRVADFTRCEEPSRFDVVHEIARFREEAKKNWELKRELNDKTVNLRQANRADFLGNDNSGFWHGQIKVFRT